MGRLEPKLRPFVNRELGSKKCDGRARRLHYSTAPIGVFKVQEAPMTKMVDNKIVRDRIAHRPTTPAAGRGFATYRHDRVTLHLKHF